MSQDEAWSVMARRFKSVHHWANDLPPLCAPLSTGANALQERLERERLPKAVKTTPLSSAEDSNKLFVDREAGTIAYDHRSSRAERDRHVAWARLPSKTILAHARTRRSCPAVLAVPSRVVAQSSSGDRSTGTRQYVHAARDARDVIERRDAHAPVARDARRCFGALYYTHIASSSHLTWL